MSLAIAVKTYRFGFGASHHARFKLLSGEDPTIRGGLNTTSRGVQTGTRTGIRSFVQGKEVNHLFIVLVLVRLGLQAGCSRL